MENVPSESKEELQNQLANPPQTQDNENQEQNMTEADDIEEDPLDQCPPDFEWAKKHREANMVKDLNERNTKSKNLEDEELY